MNRRLTAALDFILGMFLGLVLVGGLYLAIYYLLTWAVSPLL